MYKILRGFALLFFLGLHFPIVNAVKIAIAIIILWEVIQALLTDCGHFWKVFDGWDVGVSIFGIIVGLFAYYSFWLGVILWGVIFVFAIIEDKKWLQ